MSTNRLARPMVSNVVNGSLMSSLPICITPLFPGYATAERLSDAGKRNARIVFNSERGQLVGTSNMVRVDSAALADGDFRAYCLQMFGTDRDALLVATDLGTPYVIEGRRLTIQGARPSPGMQLQAATQDGVTCGDLTVRAVYRGEASIPKLSTRSFDWSDLLEALPVAERQTYPAPQSWLHHMSAPAVALGGFISLAVGDGTSGLASFTYGALIAVGSGFALADLAWTSLRTLAEKRSRDALEQHDAGLDDRDRARFGVGIRDSAGTRTVRLH